MKALFGCYYKYQSWYNIFLSQQISRTNQHKRLIDWPNRAEDEMRTILSPLFVTTLETISLEKGRIRTK